VLLMPDNTGEAEDTDWPTIEPEAHQLRTELETWADSVRDSISVAGVKIPGVRGRELERWRALKVTAVAAGPRWSAIADDVIAIGLAEAQALKDSGVMTVSPQLQLLTDLHGTWKGQPEFMPSETLVARLVAENPAYWGAESGYGKELTGKRLGRMVATATKKVSVEEHSTRPDSHGPRGYLRSQFETAWRRLGFPVDINPEHPEQSGYREPSPVHINPEHPERSGYSESPDPDCSALSGLISTGEATPAVEESSYPLCSGGCGLQIGPFDIAEGRTHHGMCA
jgi:hypothetical protein